MVRESGDVGLLLVPAVTNFERVEAKSLSRRRARKLRREDSTEVGPFLTILDPVWKILDTFWTFSALVWSIFDESPVLAGFVELSDPFCDPVWHFSAKLPHSESTGTDSNKFSDSCPTGSPVRTFERGVGSI